MPIPLIVPFLISAGFSINRVGDQIPSAATSLDALAFLVGNWESKETTKGPEGKDVAFTLKGKNTRTLGDQYLQIDEEFTVPEMGKFENHILMTFDPAVKKYRVWWFTNHSHRPIAFVGEATGKDLILTDEKDKLRIAYHFLEAGHYRAGVEVHRGDVWVGQTVAEYWKVS